MDELKDIKGFHAIEVPLWVWILLGLIAIGFLARWIYQEIKRRRNKNQLTVFELTIRKLKALNPKTDSKTFYLQYTEIVKSYLEERLQIPVLDKTAEELKDLLIDQPKASTNDALSLAKIFSKADLAKFAKLEMNELSKSEDLSLTQQVLQNIENNISAQESQISQELAA